MASAVQGAGQRLCMLLATQILAKALVDLGLSHKPKNLLLFLGRQVVIVVVRQVISFGSISFQIITSMSHRLDLHNSISHLYTTRSSKTNHPNNPPLLFFAISYISFRSGLEISRHRQVIPRPRHIVGIRAADGVLSTWTGRALFDALRGEARGLAVLVVVRHQALRLRGLGTDDRMTFLKDQGEYGMVGSYVG